MSLLQLHKKSVDAFNQQDAEVLFRVYAVDAVVCDPQYPEPLHGRDAVRDDYEQLFRSQLSILLNHGNENRCPTTGSV